MPVHYIYTPKLIACNRIHGTCSAWQPVARTGNAKGALAGTRPAMRAASRTKQRPVGLVAPPARVRMPVGPLCTFLLPLAARGPEGRPAAEA